MPSRRLLPPVHKPLPLEAPWICDEHDQAGMPNEPPCCHDAAVSTSPRRWYELRANRVARAERVMNLAVLASYIHTIGHEWAWLRSPRTQRVTDRVR